MQTKTDAKPQENVCGNDQRPEFLLILESKVAQKLGLQGPFLHMPESTHSVPVNQVSWSRIKTFWENGQKPPKLHIFTYFCH